MAGLHAGKKRKLKTKRFDGHFGRQPVKKSGFFYISKVEAVIKKIENGETPFFPHGIIRNMLNFQKSPKSGL